MRLVPITQRSAFDFIQKNHRHHKKPVGSIFQIGLEAEGVLVGVVVVGRPNARMLQDGFTAEVTRLCTDGTKNSCSMLYSAAWRAARAMGYLRLGTYILDSEPGTTLRASGWKMLYTTSGGSWNHPGRPREDKAPTCPKQRWEIGEPRDISVN